MPATFDPHDADLRLELLGLAERAARAGGALAQERFGGGLHVRLKQDRSEVSDADEAAQRAIIALLRDARPNDAVIAEEVLTGGGDGPAPANDVPCWVVDPIDGTRNFVRGIPSYCCSVGLMFGGTPLAGAIFNPSQGTLYSALSDGPLYVDGVAQELDPEAHAIDGVARLVVGIPSTTTGAIQELAHACLDRFIVRNLGTTALHLALVAAGQFDASLNANARLWDIAAGAALVMAGGGRFTTPAGAPLFPLDVGSYAREEIPCLAASPAAFDRILQAA